MAERRKHLRKIRSMDFYCYVDGVRFDSLSLDISAGVPFSPPRIQSHLERWSSWCPSRSSLSVTPEDRRTAAGIGFSWSERSSVGGMGRDRA